MTDPHDRLDPDTGEKPADGPAAEHASAYPVYAMPPRPEPRAEGAAAQERRLEELRRRHRQPDGTPGALVLIGGATDPLGEAFGSFLRLTGAQDGGTIVGITTASTDPLQSAQEWMEAFTRAGATHVEIPVIDRRDRAQDRAIAALVREADGVFLGGGDQVQLVSTLGGSRVGRAIREAYLGGAAVCGTSAGAAALTETILAGGEPDEYGQLLDLYMGPGFGLLGFHSMIDTHFAQRRRLQRLFMVIARNPELLGLGIDEDTAMVVHGHLAEVVGRGSVTFVDGRGVRFDNAEECLHEGIPLTLSYLRVGIVGAGYAFNLQARELEVLVQARAHEEETPVVRGDAAEDSVLVEREGSERR